MSKKIIFIDMDGVLVNFEKAFNQYHKQKSASKYVADAHLSNLYRNDPDLIPGIFRDAEPMPGAIDAVKKLYQSGLYDICVATTSPWDAPDSAADKMFWIQKYLGQEFYKSMTITHRKDLLHGDYLIDDRTANGAGEFKGKLIQFGTEKYPDWDAILEELL
jgi:5'(3')-deoxyribonucleotidase